MKEGVVGVGGVIKIPNGIVEYFLWGLGKATNNQAKLWDLWKGVKLLSHQNHTHVLIFGDSQLVIKKYLELIKGPPFVMFTLCRHRLKLRLDKFRSANFFHVKWGLNDEVDHYTNEGEKNCLGDLQINNKWEPLDIPP